MQMRIRFGTPFRMTVTRWTFGLNFRFVFRLEWLTLWPNIGFLPQSSHIAMVVAPSLFCEAALVFHRMASLARREDTCNPRALCWHPIFPGTHCSPARQAGGWLRYLEDGPSRARTLYSPWEERGAVAGTRIDVLLDGAFIAQPRTGSGQYTLALWRELARNDDPVMTLALPAQPPVDLADAARALVLVPPTRWPSKVRKLWWEQRGIPQLARAAQPRLVHIPYFAAPLRLSTPFVVTVHDVIPLVLPEYRASLAMRFYTALMRRTVRRARLILTDSEWSRKDIVRVLGYPAERIRVVPLGVEERFAPTPESDATQALAQAWGITGPVVLNLGGFDVRKNLPLLVRAFARALPRLPAGTRLVILGQPHSANPRLYPPLAPLIRELGLEQHVLLPGPVSEEEKLLWYRLASVYAYPSRYEGFGLSPLEAMACGTPVIAARCTSLPEVVGEAGILVEPEEDAFAEALVRVLTDAELRCTLRERGLARARMFSWQRTAEQTLTVYREAIAEAGGNGLRAVVGKPCGS